jgi:hypothetical protein
MFVTNHVLSGVMIGQAMKGRPVAAFLAGVASHLVLDAVPHWGCDFGAGEGMDQFMRIARRDGILGLGAIAVATVAVDRESRSATVAAMAGAAFLDIDKPIEHFFGVRPFPELVMRLHKAVQNESTDGMGREVGYGVLFALADTIAIAVNRSATRRGPLTSGG